RLGDFLANLKDWALSRDRYWGTPLNLWTCDACGETIAVGSREDMVERSLDKKLARTVELHRPYVDKVELACPKCGKRMHRVSNVIDTWFDSGSMHTAQWHYPFENEETFKESFPADFICEAIDQTRGWFYTLLATSTIVHGEAPFRNCIVTGHGLDEDGIKMSKSKGNVIDPWELVDLYGADCLRWYFYSSSAPWKSKRLGKDAVKEPLYRFLDTLRNTYDFFALYASIDDFDPQVHRGSEKDLSVLDRWVLSRLSTTVKNVADALDRYDVISATGTIEDFLDEVSNWYIRSSRRRFWKGGMEPDKIAAYRTLYRVLIDLSKVIAPFVPFISEAIYQRLRTPEDPGSVHLCRYPQTDPARIDADLDLEMSLARGIVSLGHQARHQSQVKVRQPLARILVTRGDAKEAHFSEEVLALVQAELNVEEIILVPSLAPYMEEVSVPNFRTLGPRFGAHAQGIAEWIKGQKATDLREALCSGSALFEVDGESVTINAEDVSFEAVLPTGLILAEEGNLHLLLDTTLDDALREKGLVREVIHRIQVLRKDAGFEVTDRIALGYHADERCAAVIAKNREMIASEVLALKMEPTLEGEHEFQKELRIDESSITFGLSRIVDSR
ncbi:class I tRNA ligase family protein, partial [Candidatus Bipolaricaulota bacterium]|nr:class I tRNA ligase family protein [Candidatus Bipolaricaulota bacterium]